MHDQVSTIEVSHPQAPPGGEWVAHGYGDDKLLLSQGCHRQGAVDDGRPEQGKVDAPLAQRLDLVGDEHLAAEGTWGISVAQLRERLALPLATA